MAVDKLVDSTQLDADLTIVANAIRTKGGTSAQMAFPAGFVSAVQAIPTGDLETITIVDATLTTTKNFDAYFSQIIDGWDTEIIFLGKTVLENLPGNRLVAGFSAYGLNCGFTQMWRKSGASIQSVSRSDWAINIAVGDTYNVVRMGVFA